MYKKLRIRWWWKKIAHPNFRVEKNQIDVNKGKYSHLQLVLSNVKKNERILHLELIWLEIHQVFQCGYLWICSSWNYFKFNNWISMQYTIKHNSYFVCFGVSVFDLVKRYMCFRWELVSQRIHDFMGWLRFNCKKSLQYGNWIPIL